MIHSISSQCLQNYMLLNIINHLNRNYQQISLKMIRDPIWQVERWQIMKRLKKLLFRVAMKPINNFCKYPIAMLNRFSLIMSEQGRHDQLEEDRYQKILWRVKRRLRGIQYKQMIVLFLRKAIYKR
jgi:hypothetical protein